MSPTYRWIRRAGLCDVATTKVNDRALQALLAGPHGAVVRDLARRAVRVESRAKTFVRVDTGRLRASIAWAAGVDNEGPFVDIGTNVEYGIYQEGFKRVGASIVPRASSPREGGYTPYLRPALPAALD